MDNIEIDTPLWRLQRVRTGVFYGAGGRAKSRAQRRRASEKKALNQIKQHCPNWLQGNGQEIPLAEVEALLKLLAPLALSADEYKFMHNFVCQRLADGNDSGAWTAKLPSVILTQRREEPPRSVADFQMLNQWRQAQRAFIDWLKTNDGLFAMIEPMNKADKQRLLSQCILFSAMTYGGLCETDALNVLLPALAKNRVYQYSKHVWVELYMVSKNKSKTANPIDVSATLRRWFPDVLTLALINYCRKNDLVTLIDGESAQALISELLQKRHFALLAKASLISLCKIASQAYEIDNLSTPSFMSAWNTGLCESHSLPNHVWCKLAGASLPVDEKSIKESTPVVERPEFNTLSLALEFSQTGNDVDYVAQLREVRDCLRPCNYTGKRVTQHKAKTNLQQLIDYRLKQFSPTVQILAFWAFSLLTVGSRYKPVLKPQSVNKYLSIIGRDLVVTAQNENLLMYDSEEFELLYQELASKYANKPKQMARMLGRFDEFHAFLVKQYDVEALQQPLLLRGTGQQPTVCANYINENEYKIAKQNILNNSELLPNDRNGFHCLLILAYRTGLRVGELSKLTLKDIHQDNEWILRIRTNQYGTNKSESAYRLVPLRSLLTNEEYVTIAAYVSHRLKMPREQNLLLFTEPALPNQKLEAATIKHYVVKPLRAICADETVTFHTLRHCAINNWYIRLFIKEQDWLFDPALYPQIPLKSVDLVGAGNIEAGRELYAIAVLAGHCSPQQTLLSYCHFLDMHQYLATSLASIPADIQLFSRLLQDKETTIQREINRKRPANMPQLTLKERIIRQATTWVVQLNQAENIELIEEFADTENYRLDSGLILTITSRYDKGHSLAAISTELGLRMAELEGVIAAAKQIAEIKTAKGRSRLIAHRRQRTIHTQYIDSAGQHEDERTTVSPGIPTDKNEERDAHTILANLRNLLRTREAKADALWFIDYVIHNVSTHKPGVPVYKMADAKRFVGVLKRLVNPGRIYLLHTTANSKFQPATYSQSDFHSELLSELSINVGAYHHVGTLKAASFDCLGKLQVCLMSLSQNQIGSSGRPKAAHSLVFACHVAAIGLRAKSIS